MARRLPARETLKVKNERIAGQVETIRNALQDDQGNSLVGVAFRRDPTSTDSLDGAPSDLHYLYRNGHLLVRDPDVERVRGVVPGDVVGSLISGVSLYAPKY